MSLRKFFGCVLPDDTVIDGLYAVGNASAPVMGRSYAGAGATIGPAMTFGYVAAVDIAKRVIPYDPISDSTPDQASNNEEMTR